MSKCLSTATFVAAVVSLSITNAMAQDREYDGNVVPATFVDPRAAGSGIDPFAGETSPAPQRQSTTAEAIRLNPDQLPNTAGQVWRQYDLREYTSRITTTRNPQQAILDWILKDTGTDMWFGEPLGVLSASADTLYVYHTPEIQAVVERTVDRFLRSQGRSQVIGIRLMTVGSPNWRSSAYTLMQPIDVVSPGVEGWMISKENAAVLLNQLRRRTDYVDHGSGDLTAPAGQRMVLNQTRPIDFTSAVRWIPGRFPPYETIDERIDEGYALDLNALVGTDGAMEAIIRCSVDQVERLQAVDVDVPNNTGGVNSVRIGVPQTLSWRLHERFRWPADQVLLLSCGVVANPSDKGNGITALQSLFNRSAGRADALLMLEYKGPATSEPAPPVAAQSTLVPVQRAP
jgi:hypothetical protein